MYGCVGGEDGGADDGAVSAWLEATHLGVHAAAFRDAGIDAATLPLLTDDDLKGMGVAALGARRKILAAIAAKPLFPGDVPRPEVPLRGPVLGQASGEGPSGGTLGSGPGQPYGGSSDGPVARPALSMFSEVVPRRVPGTEKTDRHISDFFPTLQPRAGTGSGAAPVASRYEMWEVTGILLNSLLCELPVLAARRRCLPLAHCLLPQGVQYLFAWEMTSGQFVLPSAPQHMHMQTTLRAFVAYSRIFPE